MISKSLDSCYLRYWMDM